MKPDLFGFLIVFLIFFISSNVNLGHVQHCCVSFSRIWLASSSKVILWAACMMVNTK